MFYTRKCHFYLSYSKEYKYYMVQSNYFDQFCILYTVKLFSCNKNVRIDTMFKFIYNIEVKKYNNKTVIIQLTIDNIQS